MTDIIIDLRKNFWRCLLRPASPCQNESLLRLRRGAIDFGANEQVPDGVLSD